MSFASIEQGSRMILAALLLALSLVSGCASSGPGPAAEAPSVADANAQRRYQQALDAIRDGDVAGAEISLQALIGDYPELDGPRMNLAILFADSGRNAEALVLVEEVLAHDPADAVAWNQLGILARRTGEFQTAEEAYIEALELSPDYGLAHRNLGVLLDLYMGQPEQALIHYERYLEISGPDPEVARWVTELEMRLGLPVTSRVAER
ncbi:MAG: tetratricopeptide repeat protein [Gammaproteobacteria bacterium]